MAEQPQDWAPVAEHAVGAFGTWPETVQLTVSVSAAIVLLAGIAVWHLSRRRSPEDQMVPATVMITVTEEFSRQVGHLATTVEGVGLAMDSLAKLVERMEAAIQGCATCHYNPHRKE
jgi:chromate transport protein ChrA